LANKTASISDFGLQDPSAVIPKVFSADHWWSANFYINQYVVLHGPPNFYKWSTNQKSLGTTAPVYSQYKTGFRPVSWQQQSCPFGVHEDFLWASSTNFCRKLAAFWCKFLLPYGSCRLMALVLPPYCTCFVVLIFWRAVQKSIAFF